LEIPVVTEEQAVAASAGEELTAAPAAVLETAGTATALAAAAATSAVDWQHLSSQLSMAGFEPLNLKAPGAAAAAAAGDGAGSALLPELESLHDTLAQVSGLLCR
jgi:hypothetical protein